MDTKGKYCCFFCPKKDYSEKSLDDACPTCGRPYGFVLKQHPKQILEYKIVKSLGRGFYAAAYIAETTTGLVVRKYVIKISPASFYSYFGKDPFEDEVQLHAELAENAAHVVGIIGGFPNKTVEFSDDQGTRLTCHVTVLDYVEGPLLKDYISGAVPASVAEICQIIVDLLIIRSEFDANRLKHNDLHTENLIVKKLRPEARRLNVICNSIRVVTIDIGSTSDESMSSEQRFGDARFIAAHIDALLGLLLREPLLLNDRDFRIALSLQGVAQWLQSPGQNVRIPNVDDLTIELNEAYYRASRPWRPWREPLTLKKFDDHYNAQTLASWYVPKLIVDPGNRWIDEITKPGPQIITGMRGCGKTLFLRALDIHARIAENDDEPVEETIKRIKSDGFVGLYVSAQRLLDLRPQSLSKIEYRLSRLFISYALQATRALLHLGDVAPEEIAPNAHSKLASAVANLVSGADDLRQSVSIEDLEHRLTNILVFIVNDTSKYAVRAAPTEVFTQFADQFLGCSEVFHSSSVLYLLDDISTRYFEIDKIEDLLSALLFQSPSCAFKFTSEWQTIELGLKSPGREHPIREGRDITFFDLGAHVHSEINLPGNKGKKFVSDILQKRAEVNPSYSFPLSPKNVLGDVSLEQVAREITVSKKTSRKRREVYRGLSCLANVCVGDIGDVIKLYEEMLGRAPAGSSLPISDDIQSKCFLELNSRRLYDLNRRKGYFKDHALAFAEASHELLIRSHREAERLGKEKPRLRQYSSIYVRVTADDEKRKKQQIDRLRDLIDASVFVFAGGSPRTKTKDPDPILQFILSFRKIYGLGSYIGLADRDRFELSGADLEEWLEKPASAKEILIRNQIKDELEAACQADDGVDTRFEAVDGGAIGAEVLLETGSDKRVADLAKANLQGHLFGIVTSETGSSPPTRLRARPLDVEISQIKDEELRRLPIDAILTGLGFEDRALASNQYLSEGSEPRIVYAVRYHLEGHAKEILNTWTCAGRKVQELPYVEAKVSFPEFEGLSLIDVSGLTKPLIFKAVRRELASKKRVLVCHAAAESHYPLQEDLQSLFAAEKSQEPTAFLDRLAKVLTGEKGPYEDIRLIDEHPDPTRSRALFAFASPKHERLFTLLDRREFDSIMVIAPDEDTPRARVAVFAADFICKDYPNARMARIGTDNLLDLVRYLDGQYLDIYGTAGANIELGLTGSKTQAVAAAILAARRKVAQAWYISPKEFDEKRFSTGVGRIRVFDIRIPSDRGV